jgi:uracil-DNA glycosylase
MSADQDMLRERLKLMTRAERTFGSSGVRFDAAGIPVARESDPDPSPIAEVELTPATVAPDVRPALQPTPINFGPDRPGFSEPAFPRAEKIDRLRQLDEGHVAVCRKCVLCATRTQTVFGTGDADARLMFIGEGPGENEDLQGKPFVGRAGELLTKMIGAMGLSRETVFIANIVKCRPPNNRVPSPEEVNACTPYLERQIELIRPEVIVTLGLPASQYMLQTKDSMSKMRGAFRNWRGIKLMPTYHPAYVLRNYTDQTRAAVWSDLQQVMKELGSNSTRG